VDRLVQNGFDRNDIDISSGQKLETESAARGNTGMTGRSPDDTSGGGISGFFRRIFGSDDSYGETRVYSEALSHGNAVVCVNADDDRRDRAADLLNESGAIDIDERAASWGFSDRSTGRALDEGGERTIPVVEEELHVGKRAVQRGRVRVFNRVIEQPVEEQVNLREEHVRVDRRSANRPATEADLRTHDEVIEVTETAEEPVVEKRTRVVEEVVIGKESHQRTETIRDKVRRSEVEVENAGGYSDYDDDFRSHFKSRYGSTRSARYETYAPAYQYGYRMASDDRYRGRKWDDVESTLRSDYERSNPNSAWEQVKDAVRHGWDKVTGRR
jgi:uncharacterized protein (TIGR02271 family)